MKVYEFGEEHTKIFAMFQCAVEHWWVFKDSAEEMAKDYPDGSGYEARFTSCGICTLMKELGLFDLVPAMCRLDYTMSEAGDVSEFVREYTPASGGPYCDCGYKKKRG